MLSWNDPAAKQFFEELQQAESGKTPEVKEKARIQFIANMLTEGVTDPAKLVNTDDVKTWFDNLVWLTYKLDTDRDPAFLQRVKDARKFLVYTIKHENAKRAGDKAEGVEPAAKKAKPAGDGGAARDSSDEDDCVMLPDPPLRVVDISNEPDNEPDQLVIDLSNEADD